MDLLAALDPDYELRLQLIGIGFDRPGESVSVLSEPRGHPHREPAARHPAGIDVRT